MLVWLGLLLISVNGFDLAGLARKRFADPPFPGDAGQFECIGCTLVLSVIEQLADIHGKTVDKVLDEFCYLFPLEVQATCLYYVNLYGEEVVRLFTAGYNSDEVCHGISACTDPTCRLVPTSSRSFPVIDPTLLEKVAAHKRANQWDPWGWLKNLINKFGNNHEPLLDFDGDIFSPEPDFRGSTWRGRDCNDFDSDVHPGRIEEASSGGIDQNCNGIYKKNGIDYEKLYCEGSGQLGAILLGDSAGAHFHIPPDWMNASAINGDTYNNLLFMASNELDMPWASAWTGYINGTADQPVASIYKELKSRNRCNHRDYQNVGVNGARSGATVNIVKDIARNQTLDYPVLFNLELIGNDVCSPHHNTDFTTPAEFKKNILAILTYLDTILPAGSHVLMTGLAQGSVLWDFMHARTHPIGTTYANVYQFLNCMHASPCWTWMNSNSTVREAGDKRAAELSDVYPTIVAGYKFKNFDMIYKPFPFKEIVSKWTSMGGQPWQLIEPSDGFHPNQIANWLTAQYTISILPDSWLGPVNPNNDKIATIFGDQNGY